MTPFSVYVQENEICPDVLFDKVMVGGNEILVS